MPACPQLSISCTSFGLPTTPLFLYPSPDVSTPKSHREHSRIFFSKPHHMAGHNATVTGYLIHYLALFRRKKLFIRETPELLAT